MSVIVDTSAWSMLLRRRVPQGPQVEKLERLIAAGEAALLPVVRLEVLSGIRDESHFQTVRHRLRSFPDHPLSMTHYETAAEYFGDCRRRGVQGSPIEFLLCATSVLDDLPILTNDRDFDRYAEQLPIRLL